MQGLQLLRDCLFQPFKILFCLFAAVDLEWKFRQLCCLLCLFVFQFVIVRLQLLEREWQFLVSAAIKIMFPIICSVQRGKWAASWQNQPSECAPSKESDQPGHLPSLIRVFAVRIRKLGPLATGPMLRLIWVFAGRTLILLVLSWSGSNGLPTETGKVVFEPHRDKTKKFTVRLAKTQDQSEHPPSLIKVFTVRSMDS